MSEDFTGPGDYVIIMVGDGCRNVPVSTIQVGDVVRMRGAWHTVDHVTAFIGGPARISGRRIYARVPLGGATATPEPPRRMPEDPRVAVRAEYDRLVAEDRRRVAGGTVDVPHEPRMSATALARIGGGRTVGRDLPYEEVGGCTCAQVRDPRS